VVRASGTRGTGEKSVQIFGGKSRRKEITEDQGVDGTMGSECILGTLVGGGVDWIRLAQDRDR
jgi:hypothetical protein